MTVQGYRLAVWPHLTLGALALTGLVWFMTAAASGTGWSTLWLGFTSLVFLAGSEAALRGGMYVPAVCSHATAADCALCAKEPRSVAGGCRAGPRSFLLPGRGRGKRRDIYTSDVLRGRYVSSLGEVWGWAAAAVFATTRTFCWPFFCFGIFLSRGALADTKRLERDPTHPSSVRYCCRWHFKWWAPAERFAFLKPWGDSPVGAGGGRGGGDSYGGYAPPRPSAAPPAAVPPRSEYGSNMGGAGGGGDGGGIEGGGGGGGGGGEMLGAVEDNGAGKAADIGDAASGAAAVAAAPDVSSNTESTGLLEESTTTGEEELEAIFASESA